jgi:peptide/nickel transport system ATP-binding protein
VTPILDVAGLRIRLPTPDGPATVVDGIDYSIEPGEVFGIAGESGSGKTMSVLALMGLLPQGAAVEGHALFEGRDLLRLPPSTLRRICGRELAMVFQDPMTSLHPMLSIGTQLTEHVRLHLGLGRRAAAELAVEALREVRIPDPQSALQAFPHQFSGGMRQRIAIAVALACRPKLLVADEPTTALDVTIQAQILDVLKAAQRETHAATILITHDLGVIAELADRVAVMYAGRVVEIGPVRDVIHSPRHPYTVGLMGSIPKIGYQANRLVQIEGAMPRLNAIPPGCAFNPRCPRRFARCLVERPGLLDAGSSRAACWLHAPA